MLERSRSIGGNKERDEASMPRPSNYESVGVDTIDAASTYWKRNVRMTLPPVKPKPKDALRVRDGVGGTYFSEHRAQAR